jgi:hypothetical protein
VIDAASPASASAARLRVRALRLLAERRLGRRLTHVGAVELLERHGAVDAALDAMAAERATARDRGGVDSHGAQPRSTVPPRPGTSVTNATDGEPAQGGASRAAGWAAVAHEVALAVAGVTALIVALAALGRVRSAIETAHGAPWTLALGSTAVLVAAVSAAAFARRRGRIDGAPRLEATVLGLTAVAAALAVHVEDCALRAPLGLQRVLAETPLSLAIAGAAIAAAAAAIVTSTRKRSPERA